MLTYNSQLKKLALPEYGRNIQNMVDYCCTIEDRQERNRCAYTIIQSMGNLFPQLRDTAEYQHKLWDHLAIMSDFQLDIDYPCEVLKEESFTQPPERIGYSLSPIRFRHYGRLLEGMIARACEIEDFEQREALSMLIANHMKKQICQISNEEIDDAKIFKDLSIFSRGRINLDPRTHVLHEYTVAPQVTNNKKKKKK